MNEKEIRLLKADEIECRVGIINEKGLSLLLYKDARTDIALLNEAYGPMGWQKTYQSINGELFCTVSVWDEDKNQWVSKQDIGMPSFAESEKGRASDAFKRSSVCWGCGIELYGAPFIYLKAGTYEVNERNGKLVVKDRFHVEDISYDDERKIVGLKICNQKGEVVFEQKTRKVRSKQSDMQITVQQLSELTAEMQRAGVTMDKVLDRYGLGSISEMTPEIFERAMRGLSATLNKINERKIA